VTLGCARGEPAVSAPSPVPKAHRTLAAMTDVALLDDHPAVLAGLRRLIDSEHDLSVLAAASTATDLAKALDGRHPDVIVLDYDLSRGDGLSHCRRIKARREPPGVIVYSAYAGPALNLAARVAGADGVVDKAAPVADLLTTIRRVAAGLAAGAPPVPRHAYEAAVARLDDEDLPILAMLLDGVPHEAIAEALRLDRTEVAWRVQRIVGRIQPRIRRRRDDLERLSAAEGQPTRG
jgi:two-component system, NarL family, response regulator DevR